MAYASPTGCVADGVTDDRVALQASINSATANGDILILNGKTYAVSSPGLIVSSNTQIIGQKGVTTLKAIGSGWNGALITGGGSYGVQPYISASNGGSFLSSVTTEVTPTYGSTSFNYNDLVLVENTDTWSGLSVTHRELTTVNVTAGGNVNFNRPLLIPTTGAIRTLFQIFPLVNITVRDIVLDGISATGTVVQGMYLYLVRNADISLNIKNFQNFGYGSLMGYQNTYDLDVFGCGSGSDAGIYLQNETSCRCKNLRSHNAVAFGIDLVNLVDFKIDNADVQCAGYRGFKISGSLFGSVDNLSSSRNYSTGVSIQSACGHVTFNKPTVFNNGWGNPSGGFVLQTVANEFITVHDLTSYGNLDKDLNVGTQNYNTRFYFPNYGTSVDNGTGTVFAS